jgi:hypothetical protein
MVIPFTLEQFLDVFGAYNRALWPAALLLWVATLLGIVLLLRRDRRATRVLGVLLAIHWAWSGIAYHFAYFRSINPAASLFAVLFVVQAGLFLWWTLQAAPTAVQVQATLWSRLGVALMIYGLAYPALGLALGLGYPRMPTFGVPCPTTLFTVGALLVGRSTMPRSLGIIPLAWTVVGGSAAFHFGVRADFALPVAGAILLASMVLGRRRRSSAG